MYSKKTGDYYLGWGSFNTVNSGSQKGERDGKLTKDNTQIKVESV